MSLIQQSPLAFVRQCVIKKTDGLSDEQLRRYVAAIAESDKAIEAVGDPSALAVGSFDGEIHTLRWVLAHMTGETARHAGDADILREQIDGTTGR